MTRQFSTVFAAGNFGLSALENKRRWMEAGPRIPGHCGFRRREGPGGPPGKGV